MSFLQFWDLRDLRKGGRQGEVQHGIPSMDCVAQGSSGDYTCAYMWVVGLPQLVASYRVASGY